MPDAIRVRPLRRNDASQFQYTGISILDSRVWLSIHPDAITAGLADGRHTDRWTATRDRAFSDLAKR